MVEKKQQKREGAKWRLSPYYFYFADFEKYCIIKKSENKKI